MILSVCSTLYKINKSNRDAPSLLNNIPVLFTDTLVLGGFFFIKIGLGHVSREGLPHYMQITFAEHNEKYNTGHNFVMKYYVL